jgi:hypothetical protein
MEVEDTGGDLAPEETDQEPEQAEEDNLSDYVDGFDVEPPEKEEKKEESDKDKKAPTDGEEKNVKDTPKVEDYEKKIKDLESHVSNLNRAVHQYRQKEKETKKEEENPLTPEQLRAMFKEHKDDPETLFNIVAYMSEQSAKQAGKEALDVEEIKKMKTIHDDVVSKRWPDLEKEGSQLRTQTDKLKKAFRLETHPMSDYLVVSAMISDQLPQIQQAAYEKGKADALKGKAEENRKKDVKDGKLSPAKSGASDKPNKALLSGSYAEVAKQMGLTKSQQEIYAKLVNKKK